MIVWYSQMPSAKQTSITNAYNNNYLAYDSGYDRLMLDSFLNSSIAFSPKSAPSWSNVYDWSYPGLADASEFRSYTSNISIVARCIYAENTNAIGGYSLRQKAMRATADVI